MFSIFIVHKYLSGKLQRINYEIIKIVKKFVKRTDYRFNTCKKKNTSCIQIQKSTYM